MGSIDDFQRLLFGVILNLINLHFCGLNCNFVTKWHADHWAVEGDGINTRDATMSKPGGGEGTRTEFTLVDAVCLVREHRRVFCVFADMNIKFDALTNIIIFIIG